MEPLHHQRVRRHSAPRGCAPWPPGRRRLSRRPRKGGLCTWRLSRAALRGMQQLSPLHSQPRIRKTNYLTHAGADIPAGSDPGAHGRQVRGRESHPYQSLLRCASARNSMPRERYPAVCAVPVKVDRRWSVSAM